MKLNVLERLNLINLLPSEDTFAGMGEVVRLKLTLNLTGEEIEELAETVDGRERLNNVKALAHIKEIPVNEYMTKTIRKILREKDDEGKIREEMMSLFEKFVLDYI